MTWKASLILKIQQHLMNNGKNQLISGKLKLQWSPVYTHPTILHSAAGESTVSHSTAEPKQYDSKVYSQTVHWSEKNMRILNGFSESWRKNTAIVCKCEIIWILTILVNPLSFQNTP